MDTHSIGATTTYNRVERRQIGETIQMLCVVAIAVWGTAPPVAYSTAYRLFAIGAVALWFLIEFASRPVAFLRPSGPMVLSGIFVVYSALVAYMTEGPSEILRNFQVYIFLLFLIIHESFRKRDVRKLLPVVWIILASLPIWMALTIAKYGEVQSASRLIVRDSDSARELTAQGVGGYSLVYSVVVVMPVLFALLFKRQTISRMYSRRIWRLVFLGIVAANFALAVVIILRAGYTLAVSIMAVEIAIVVLVGRRPRGTLRATGLLLVIVPFLLLLVRPIFVVLSSASEKTLYSRKVDDIDDTLEAGTATGTVSDRWVRYRRSLIVMWDNPVTGSITSSEIGGPHIGGHSSLLDKLARYGLFIGGAFCYLVLFLPIRFIRRRPTHFGVAMAMLFSVGTLSLLNTIPAALGFVVFIAYPVLMPYLAEETVPTTSAPTQKSAQATTTIP